MGLCFVFLLVIKANYTVQIDCTDENWSNIQPIFGKVIVITDIDTPVMFTNVTSGKTFSIDYLTPGLGESIKLERAQWYNVEDRGHITIICARDEK